ncbi:MAG: hypothetical protein GEU75_07785 [Dehalococcoidia bacterium]|nr:hypothetical protein [Dehalococcoidia bacterium]
MIAQIRLYTINKGEMDAFLTHFQEAVVPWHKSVGVNIASTFVNRPQNEFIWVRTYDDEADREAKQKLLNESPLRAAMAATLGSNVAKMEIRDVEVADVGAGLPA